MYFSQLVDIIGNGAIHGFAAPFIGSMSLLHTAATQDTLHINARGVA